MPLTDTAIRAVKPTAAIQKLYDGRGLLLQVDPSGGRYWRYKYRYAGKEKQLALGVYPEVTLRMARERLDDARRQLAQGNDPGAQKRTEKLTRTVRTSNSLRVVADEWLNKNQPSWADSHYVRIKRRLERDIYPHLGARPLPEISAPELLAVLRVVEKRAVETAHRALRDLGQVFRYGIATGRCARDTAADLRGSLGPMQHGHMAATLETRRLGAILRLMDSYPGGPVVTSALRLAPLVFVRPGELRRAEWKSIDLDAAEWRFFVSKQRAGSVKTELIVPLAAQAVAILKALHPITGEHRLVFPGARDHGRPMSDAAILVAMRSMEIGKEEMSGHGFRAVARTLLDEVLGFRPDFIEHQLAHAVRDPNGRAYNRTSYLAERRRMMQAWADYLDQLKSHVLVMPARRAG